MEQLEKRYWERKTNKFHSMTQAIRSQIDQSLSKPRKRLKGSNGPCDLGPKQDQTKFEWKTSNHPKIATKQWTTTKRMRRSNQRVDWIDETPKLPRRARYTKPLDALGLKTWNRWRKANNQRTKANSQSNRTPTHSGSQKIKKKNTDQT